MSWTIAGEIERLSKLAGIPCNEFRHLIVCTNYSYPSSAEPQTLLTYAPAANTTWIVTYMFLRSLPPVNAATLTAAGTSSGDFRSDDVDPSGLAVAWLETNGNPITGILNPSFTFFNKPVLFAFKGPDILTVNLQRPVLSVPPTTRIHLALSGYVAPPKAFDCLANNVTRVEGFSS